MSPEQFKQVEELFFKLSQLPAHERAPMLDLQCPDDQLVRKEVELMLRHGVGDTPGSELSRFSRQLDQVLPRGVNLDADSRQLVGRTVGAYELTRFIGHGGMGVVYQGRDTRLGRMAALKAVLPDHDDNPTHLERLRREARILASLSHPNIATIYGLEEAFDTLFIVMEFIDGKTLSQRLGRSSVPVPEALRIVEQVCAGLEAAHEAGVVHRDLKPGNVMFTADGVVKVLDFGLARDVRPIEQAEPSDETRHLTLTRRGSFFGTPAYMSPEQARGEAVDQRSDIFSLGCILFRCLTGRPAFDGDSDAQMIEGILHHEPQWELLPAQTPPAVRALLRRCLAKDPQERYRHIGDVRLDLRDAMAARTWEMRRDNAAGAGRLWTWLAAAACVVAVASVSIGIAAWRRPAQVSQAAAAQRFDVLFPENALQRDLERVQLALSPDGRSIVVACQTPTFGQSLWSRSHADGRWRRLEQTEGGHRPVISPDGQWIAFFRDGHIYKRRLSGGGGGGDPIRLASSTNWYGLSWTSDGQQIVYATAWGDPIVAMHDSPNAPAQIISQVMIDRGEVTHVGPVCVPGSPWVLYNAWAGGEESSVYAVNRLTRQQHFVLSNASSARVAITPKGNYIVFERASSIVAAPFDRTTGKVIGPEAVVVDGVMNDGTRFSAYFDVAADGTLAYIPGTSFTEQSRLAFVNENGMMAAFNDDRTSFCEPAFSADGRRLAVIIKGKLYRVLIYDLERQTEEFIVTGGDTVSVAISPDGGTIACTVNRDGGYGIDLFSLKDHRRLRRIVPPGPDYPSDLHWSADGKFITFTMSPAENAPRDIWLVEPTDDPKPRPLVTSSAADFHASPSPDGKWVAYTSDISGRREVYLVALDRGTTRQITSGGGESPAWSPDGRSLFYIAPNGLVSVGITPDGVVAGRPTVVHDKPFGQSDPIARNYTVAPDGRPLIVERSESAPTVSHVNVITNWWTLLPGSGGDAQKPGS